MPPILPPMPPDRKHQKYVIASDGTVAVRTFAPPLDFGSLNNLSQVLNDVTEFTNELGFNTIGFYCSPPTGGEITFESTYDGINWEPVSIRGVTSDELTSVITEAGNFLGSISANRCIRFKTTVAGSAPGTVMGRAQRDGSIIEHIEFHAPPHKFGYIAEKHGDSYTTAQAATEIWTPDSGKAIVLTDIFVFAHGSTDGHMTIFSDTIVNGNIIYDNDIEVATIAPLNWSHSFGTGLRSEVGEAIKITTDNAIDCNIRLFGYQI